VPVLQAHATGHVEAAAVRHGAVAGDDRVVLHDDRAIDRDEAAALPLARVGADGRVVQRNHAVGQDAAAGQRGAVVLDDVVVQRRGGSLLHEEAAADIDPRAALDGHAGEGNGDGAPRRGDVEDALGGGQAAGVDDHGAAAVVEDGHVVVQDGQL